MPRMHVEGINKVVRNFTELRKAYRAEMIQRINSVITAIRLRITKDLIDGAWGIKSRHGGGLISSIYEVRATDGTPIGEVHGGGGVAKYGKMFQEGGTHPYAIYPKAKEALAWRAYGNFIGRRNQMRFSFARNDTSMVIVARVNNHPAMRHANWFFGPVKEMDAEIFRTLHPNLNQMELPFKD